jgi:hypothetical protein
MRFILVSAAAFALCVGAAKADAPITHPYQVYSTQAAACAPGDCSILFPATTQANVVISHVSCEFSIPSGGSVGKAKLSAQNFAPEQLLPAFSFSPTGTEYGINAETYLFLAKGAQPRVDVFSNGGVPVSQYACTLSGYY